MTDNVSLLTTLQHGDSFFPSGAVSFSWGLETLFSENSLKGSQEVEFFIQTQLTERWATFDRGVVAAAFDATDNLDDICRIDRIVEAQTLPREMRDGSHRAGMALLQIHEKMGTPGADSYRERIRQSKAHGNQNVMQGFLWAQCGIDRRDAEIISAHALCIGLLGASIRLGIIGHVDSQTILTSLHKTIDTILQTPPPSIDKIHAFTPNSEIAMMRHETADSRLFAN